MYIDVCRMMEYIQIHPLFTRSASCTCWRLKKRIKISAAVDYHGNELSHVHKPPEILVGMYVSPFLMGEQVV